MKNKILKIKFESTENFFDRVTDSLKKKKKSITLKDTIIFSSVMDYQKFMTEQKYAILATIYSHKPESMYQLAKLLGRDLANVKRDCDSLDAGGFIVLKETKDNKNTKIPRLSFDYNVIVVYMPSTTYSHILYQAA